MNSLDNLNALAATLPDDLPLLCRSVLDHPHFVLVPASIKHHHYWIGGLVDHTFEVTELAREMCGTRSAQLIVTVAAIFHDFAKIYEYETRFTAGVNSPIFQDDAVAIALPYHQTTGHIVGSYLHFWKAVDSLPKRSMSLSEANERFALFSEIGHCILAHHGRKEWGSPVEPQTLEAHILHSADMTSMQRAKASQK